MTARLPGDRPVAVVGAYLYAVIRDKDFDTVRALLADDVVYENVLPEYARRPAHREDLPSDHRAKGGLGRQNPSDRERGICGVFEVHDGRITLWRDYFDVYDLLKGTVRETTRRPGIARHCCTRASCQPGRDPFQDRVKVHPVTARGSSRRSEGERSAAIALNPDDHPDD